MLQDIFSMQDLAASQNQAQSEIVRKRLAFASDAVGLATAALGSTGFASNKQHVLRVLGVDAVSAIVTSTRVALWGDLPEGIALLRCAVETSAILAAVVETENYAVMADEIQAGGARKWTYKVAIGKLGDVGVRIKTLHGRLSNVGSHANPKRFQFASYQLEGEFYDRLGAALDPARVELALFWVPDACLHLLESIEKAYSQDFRVCPGSDQLSRLRNRFDSVKHSAKTAG